ncbi:hypothetical protein ACOME3_004261 [Neoechinorhynchus agilis]
MLRSFLEDVKSLTKTEEEPPVSDKVVVGIGLDSCVIKIPGTDLFLVQTIDYFYPLIEEPYEMGKITCANVLSDIYATGVTEVNNLTFICGISTALDSKDESEDHSLRSAVYREIYRGFEDSAHEAGITVTDQRLFVNEWVLLGGVASSVVPFHEIVISTRATPGDVIVLTKPLGIQVAVNVHQMMLNPSKWAIIQSKFDPEEVKRVYNFSSKIMTRLNLRAAKLLKQFETHAITDVTGFGLLGHAQNLAEHQVEKVDFVFNTLPLIKSTSEFDDALGNPFKLLSGRAAETSGGLLAVMPSKDALEFCAQFNVDADIDQAFIVGFVQKSEAAEPCAKILSSNVKVIECPKFW